MPDAPAVVLRQAAQQLRRTAGRATPGPWSTSGPDTIAQWMIFDGEWQVANATAYNHDQRFGGKRGPGYIDADANAEWIALVHPGLAEPLAKWLSDSAEFLDGVTEAHGTVTELAVHNTRHQLAVAHIILGTTKEAAS